ncbi:hypothetical protein [Dactylosporangium darangshiense]|uniref:Restriction endonuclease n=1 Tax=Dactylosporangium darangshiense TaxID=579108 RepID=A0ABP8DI99_9ACTN
MYPNQGMFRTVRWLWVTSTEWCPGLCLDLSPDSLYLVPPPEPTRSQLDAALKSAVGRLRREDQDLEQTTERVVAARLMIYLDSELGRLPNPAGFRLDMEYERAGHDPKAFAGRGPGGHFRRKIVPDLIYHRRLDDDGLYANHLAIEVKTRPTSREGHDLAKLALLTGRVQYAFVSFRPNLLRRPNPEDPVMPPPDRHVVVLPPTIRPYTFGAFLRLHLDDAFVEWV